MTQVNSRKKSELDLCERETDDESMTSTQVPGGGAATAARGRSAPEEHGAPSGARAKAGPEARGRVNQKQRTRMAIVEATRRLAGRGAEISMPVVAREALVSEATAYRYFPDLATLLREADEGTWPSPADALAPVADSDDPVERIGYAAEVLFRGILANQGAVRAMISASIMKPPVAAARPGHRFGLIDYALAPLDRTLGRTDPEGLAQLRRDLAVVMGAEALFSLMDLCGLAPAEAIASGVHTARTVTRAAVTAGPC
jgi:AcrR family transcriptional regulator